MDPAFRPTGCWNSPRAAPFYSVMPTPPSLLLLAAAVLGLLLAGCASNEPPIPVVHYPVTYQVPVGGARISEKPAGPAANATASQDVAVEAGKPLYYEIASPTPVTVYLYEKVGAAPGANLLGQIDVPAHRTVRERVVPPTSAVEFLFAQASSADTGTLYFTLSDAPLAGGPDRPEPTFVGH